MQEEKTPKRRRLWLKVALVLLTLTIGGWLFMELGPACDEDILHRTAQKLREGLEGQKSPQEAAFDGLEEACSPRMPAVLDKSFYIPATPDTRQTLLAGPGEFVLWMRRGAIADACGLWRWEVEDLIVRRPHELPVSHAQRVYQTCALERVKDLPAEEVEGYGMDWTRLVVMMFLHDGGLLDDPDTRLVMRALFDQTYATMSPDLQPPEATRKFNTPEDDMTITATRKSVLFGDRAIVSLKDGRVDRSHKRGGEASFYIQPLFDDLTEQVSRYKQMAELRKQPFEDVANLVIDKSLPSRLLYEIAYTAGQAQIGTVRLTYISPTEPDRLAGSKTSVLPLKLNPNPELDPPVLFRLTSRGITIASKGQAPPAASPCPHAPEATLCHTKTPEEVETQIGVARALRDKYDATQDKKYLTESNKTLDRLREGLDLGSLPEVMDKLAPDGGPATVAIEVSPKIPVLLTAALFDAIASKKPGCDLQLAFPARK